MYRHRSQRVEKSVCALEPWSICRESVEEQWRDSSVHAWTFRTMVDLGKGAHRFPVDLNFHGCTHSRLTNFNRNLLERYGLHRNRLTSPDPTFGLRQTSGCVNETVGDACTLMDEIQHRFRGGTSETFGNIVGIRRDITNLLGMAHSRLGAAAFNGCLVATCGPFSPDLIDRLLLEVGEACTAEAILREVPYGLYVIGCTH